MFSEDIQTLSSGYHSTDIKLKENNPFFCTFQIMEPFKLETIILRWARFSAANCSDIIGNKNVKLITVRQGKGIRMISWL